MNPLGKGYLGELTGVFLSAAFCNYSWSLLVFFWDLPSLLLRWDMNDIMGYAAYQFMFAFAGSLIVTVFIGLIGQFLPAKYLRHNIRTTGAALVIAFAVNSIVFKERTNLINWIAGTLSLNSLATARIFMDIWIVSLVILPIFSVMIAKNKKVERVITNFVERLSVLVGLYVSLSLVGILIVIFRNFG